MLCNFFENYYKYQIIAKRPIFDYINYNDKRYTNRVNRISDEKCKEFGVGYIISEHLVSYGVGVRIGDGRNQLHMHNNGSSHVYVQNNMDIY